MVVFKLWEDNYLFGMSVLRTLFPKAQMNEVVPAHLTDEMLQEQIKHAEKYKLPRSKAEARALLRLRPEQRKEAWEQLRNDWKH